MACLTLPISEENEDQKRQSEGGDDIDGLVYMVWVTCQDTGQNHPFHFIVGFHRKNVPSHMLKIPGGKRKAGQIYAIDFFTIH